MRVTSIPVILMEGSKAYKHILTNTFWLTSLISNICPASNPSSLSEITTSSCGLGDITIHQKAGLRMRRSMGCAVDRVRRKKKGRSQRKLFTLVILYCLLLMLITANLASKPSSNARGCLCFGCIVCSTLVCKGDW